MEKIFIKGACAVGDFDAEGRREVAVEATNDVSDGYHTFGELYDHRITLFIALARMQKRMNTMANHFKLGDLYPVWKSKQHFDGTMFDGWFVAGIGKLPGEQITYHLPLSRWGELDFAEEMDKAPAWDGHTPQDTLERLKSL